MTRVFDVQSACAFDARLERMESYRRLIRVYRNLKVVQQECYLLNWDDAGELANDIRRQLLSVSWAIWSLTKVLQA